MFLDAKKVSQELYGEVKRRSLDFERSYGRRPKLIAFLSEENPGVKSYANSIGKNLGPVGIDCELLGFGDDMEGFKRSFEKANRDTDVDAIIVLRPVPKFIDVDWADSTIDPKKDVDGASPVNLGKVLLGEASALAPCTPEAVMELLDYYKIEVKGKDVVVINNSDILGKPLTMMLTNRFATVTLCHVFTRSLEDITRSADIIVTGAGVYGLIKPDMLKSGAIVIDVAIAQEKNADGEFILNPEGKRIRAGDVLEGCEEVAGMITSATPGCGGGTGPLTTAVLAQNILKAAYMNMEATDGHH